MTATADRRSPIVADGDDALGLYLYAVVENRPDRVPPSLVGLDGAEVHLVGDGDVAAVVGVVTVERPAGRRKDLLAHNTVVETLAETGPVIPVQFGTILAGTAAVVDEVVEPEAARWSALLKKLRGRRQFNLKARYHEAALLAEVVAEHPDIAALRRRTRDLPEGMGQAEKVRLGELVSRAVAAKREADVRVLLDPVLRTVVSYAERRAGSGTDYVVDMAFLVDDARRAAFEDTLEGLAEAFHERIRLQLVGPLPPYDFVDGDWWV